MADETIGGRPATITKEDGKVKIIFHPLAKDAKHPKANVFTVKLEKADVEKIKKDLFAKFGSKINLDYKVDKDLISGLIIQVGSIMIDNSMKNKLKQIKSKMIEV